MKTYEELYPDAIANYQLSKQAALHNNASISKCTHESPYIGLKASLSRTYVSYLIIVLFLILIHLSTGLSEIALINSRTKHGIASGCLKAENAANLLVASPEALLRTAKITAIAVANTATKVTGQVLSASVHLLNLIIIWVIHRYTKLVVCVFDTISGVLLDAVKAFASIIRDAINAQLKLVETVLNASLHEMNQFLATAGVVGTGIEKAVSGLIGFGAQIFGKDNPIGQIPDIQMPKVTESLHFEIPESFVNNVKSFNPPTLRDIERKFDDFVSIPFDLLRTLIVTKFDAMNVTSKLGNGFLNDTYTPIKYTFCNAKNLDLNWVDVFTNGLRNTIHVLCYVIIALMFLVVMYQFLSTLFWFKVKNAELVYLESTLSTTENSECEKKCEKRIMMQDAYQYSRHPLHHRFVISASKIFPAKKWRYRSRWFFDYVMYLPAFICIGIGLAGIISILFQIYIINKAEARQVPILVKIAAKSVEKIAEKLSIHINAITIPFATTLLHDVGKVQAAANAELEEIIDSVVTRVDLVIKTVINTYSDLIKSTLGFFPYLAETVLKFVTCMIGLNIDDVNAVGTFIKNSLKITIPLTDPELLKVSKEEIDKYVMPYFNAAYQGKSRGAGMVSGLVFALNEYKKKLWAQMQMFVLMTLFGGSIIIWGVVRGICWIIEDLILFVVKKRAMKV